MGKEAAPRKLADNEARAYIRALRVSPRKLDLVAGMIRGKRVQTALNELEFSRRRIAGAVKAALQSAVANAENNHQLDVDRLVVAEASVGKGLVMKRWRPKARGRVGRVRKAYSNLSIVVREQEDA
ncbi:MAG: 50S ribosomal protein L22 [Alphaproteobacteria bacterium]